MHPWILREFDRLCRQYRAGGAVLEIGATAADTTHLCLESLNTMEKIGLNLSGPYRFRDFNILQGDAYWMDIFQNGGDLERIAEH